MREICDNYLQYAIFECSLKLKLLTGLLNTKAEANSILKTEPGLKQNFLFGPPV